MNDYQEIPVHRVSPIEGPDGLVSYRLTLAPETFDPARSYAAQTSIDSFWPSADGRASTPVNGELWIEGQLGDPEDPEQAMLVGRPGLGRYGLRHARVIVVSTDLQG